MVIADIKVRKKINFMCLPDTKWVGKKERQSDNSENRVWIIVDKEWNNNIVDVKRVGDQIIVLKFVMEQNNFSVICAYAPQVELVELLKVKLGELQAYFRIYHREKRFV